MDALSPLALTYVVVAACHAIGDFAFQNEWMAREKGKSWEINFYHAFVYTAPFALLALTPLTITPSALAFLLVSHFFIDPLKTRWGIIQHIWQDQLLHLIVLIFLVRIGWISYELVY